MLLTCLLLPLPSGQAELAREGGLPSTLWAGPETIGRAVRDGRYPVQGTVRTKPANLRLRFAGTDFGYAMDLGLPGGGGHSMFNLDAADGSWEYAHDVLRPYDSMLSELADPQRAPDLLKVREQIRSWRFYHSHGVGELPDRRRHARGAAGIRARERPGAQGH